MPQTNLLSTALFKPFTAPNADSHARILADLYAESRRAAGPLSRHLVLDIIIHHTITAATADDPLPKAQAALNYLQECGWLRTQVQPDFTYACALTPNAFQILQAIQTSPPSSLQLLVAICDLLKAALLDVDNDARLQEAARLTDQLIDSLKTIQHNANSANALPDTARLRAAVIDAAAKLETRGHAPARTIREQFTAFNQILADIAARHAQLVTADHQPSPAAIQLATSLNRFSSLDKKTLAKHTNALICLYHQPAPQLPASDLQTPASTFVLDEIPLPELSPEEIESARREIQKQLNRPVSPDRVRRLAHSFVDGKPEARASELVAAGQVDLPLIIQLRLLGDGSLGYTLEDLSWIETNGLVFRDFILKNLEYVPPVIEEKGEDASQSEALAFAPDNDNAE